MPGPKVRRKSLPPKFAIAAGKFVWTTMWQTMMGSLAPSSKDGAYQRPSSQFRDRISTAPEHPYPPASGRYRLFVGLSCPWAHRTLVVRELKGLQDVVPVTIATADASEGGWVLPERDEGCRRLADLYQLAAPGYAGRCTVPVLWDSQTKAIVNNESSEIIEILNSDLNDWAQHSDVDLYPQELREECDRWNAKIYSAVNNGVYRCGFAQTQAAYDGAVTELFDMLDEIDRLLGQCLYLCGDRLTLADVRLFTTLIRFDAVYHGLFKCNRRRIRDYEHLWGYLRELYQMPGIADTCDLEALKQEYYTSLFPLNPGGIVPIAPDPQLLHSPHRRGELARSQPVSPTQ
ncbi:MAG: glutathione S-transferase family protein [Cyanobacteria bacterium P01_E01_bin.45]